ncbi:MAG: SGNH/GDSL hydrolase family protein [Variovorax sp.]
MSHFRRARRLALASCTVLTVLAALTAPGAQAQDAVAPSPAAYAAAQMRWHDAFAAFDKADRENPPASDGVLFVGSSTIRLWTHLADDFRSQPVVINRGFGGSTMADCSLFARELVVRYKPRQVVVYAGDNDLAEGRTPFQVLESFAQFANTVRAGLPNIRITFISVKPSPSRAALLPKIQETNHIVGAYLRTQANTDYIDIFTPMLGADGRPRAELFRADMLHMNETGYRIWQAAIAPHLLAPTDMAVVSSPR